MQIQVTPYHSTPVRLAAIRVDSTEYWRACGGPSSGGGALEQSGSQRQKGGGWAPGAGGGGWGLVLNGDRVSVWEDEKVLEMDGGGVAQRCEYS